MKGKLSMDDKMEFRISGVELERVRNFKKNHECFLPNASKKEQRLLGQKKKQGAIGGQYTYSFTPTSLGTAVSMRCACGKEENVTEYDSW